MTDDWFRWMQGLRERDKEALLRIHRIPTGEPEPDHPIRLTVNRTDLSPEQRELAQQWADDAAKIIWQGIRSALYKALFEMMEFGSTEVPVTADRTASTPSSAGSSEPPPTA